MITQEKIELEMRLSALEFFISKLHAAHIAVMNLTSAEIDEKFKSLRDEAGKQRFPGFDPAMSDLISAEWEAAIARLLDQQKAILAQWSAKG